MSWKAIVRDVKDIGNGTGDVTVDFLHNDAVVKHKTYNFTAGQITLESGREQILHDLVSLAQFDALSQVVAGMVGVEIPLPEEVERQIWSQVNE